MNNYKNLPNVEIKILNSLTDDDLYQLFQVHRKSLPDDIIINFGFNVEKKYIKKLSEENNGLIIVALKDKSIIGFIFLRFKEINMKNFLDSKAITKFIIKSLYNPKIMIRLIYQLFKPIKNPRESCEIDYFAVLEKSRSSGVGKSLIKKAELCALEKNYKKIFTKTNNKKLYSYYVDKKKASLLHSFKVLNHEYLCVCWDIF